LFLLLGCGGSRPAADPRAEPVAEPAADASLAPTIGEGLIALQAGDAATAVTVFTRITEAQPENGQAWILRGMAERAAGDAAAAGRSLERAAAIEESRPRAYYQLAVLAASGGDIDAAFEWLEKAAATGRADITGIAVEPGAAALRGDSRLAALMPDAAALADPFAEDDAGVLREWRGEAEGDQFGWIARNIGDIDGDGVADLATSAPTAAGEATGDRSGKVYAYSSKSGKRLWVRAGAAAAQLGLGLEAAGDVDADGTPDVIAGAPGAGSALVLGGRDGSILLELAAENAGDFFGREVGDAGDVDGDGHADVFVGAPRHDGARGAVYLFSGSDGSRLVTLRGERAGDRFGAAAAATTAGGELTLAIGAPDAGPDRGGRVYVYRGRLGAESARLERPAFVLEADDTGAELGGMFASVVGDVDGDGRADIYATDFSNQARGPSTGRAYVWSGTDGRLLHTFTGERAGDGFGIGAADAGDIDGDGRADLAIGAWQHGSAAPSGGRIYLYSGAGALIRTWTGQVMGETLGFDTTGLGDVDGDGIGDLLVTSAWAPVAGARTGRVFILRGTR
jgi:hypothetical protein